ncbi:hypothetical protein JYQ62_08270 [Nostoc sp. UHCC 0702]|nr:hypothetical protein JYQ62_08270 [Nostoc sp. UHCC 0702]
MSLPPIVEDPKNYLRQMMTSFSERTWSAGWYSGLEFILWRQVRECSEDLTIRELADFNFCAGLAGGWWMWDKFQKTEVFVPIEKWLEAFTQQENN